MINFVDTSKKVDLRLEKTKAIVKAITTAVLVIYILAVVGVIGWGAYWSRREVNVSKQYVELTNQVVSLSEQEVLARKLAGRVNLTKKYVASRLLAFDYAKEASADGIMVVGFKFDETGKTVVTVEGSSVDNVKAYTDMKGLKFSQVSLENISLNKERKWEGEVGLGGLIYD